MSAPTVLPIFNYFALLAESTSLGSTSPPWAPFSLRRPHAVAVISTAACQQVSPAESSVFSQQALQHSRLLPPIHASAWGLSPTRATICLPLASGDFKGTISTSGPPPLLPLDVALVTLQRHPELQALLSLLPSKQDMQLLANDLKAAWWQDLRMAKSDILDLQDRVQKLETSHPSVQHLLSDLQASSTAKAMHQQHLDVHLDDLENCSRQNNVRIQGLPETICTQDLIPALMKIFNLLLGKPVDTY